MNLVLVIETSSSPFGVVLGSNKNVFFNSAEGSSLKENRDLPLLVVRGLEVIGERADNIGIIAVNIGPGGLSSVRAGVSFANALAYGLGIPVCPFTSFELIGFEAWKKFQLPVLCTARATEGNAYVGLYEKGAVKIMRFGLLEDIVKEVTFEIHEFTVAGPHRNIILELFNNSKIHDSGIQVGQAKTFMEMEDFIVERRVFFPDIVSPINEQSGILYE